jgi:hypothetical protein
LVTYYTVFVIDLTSRRVQIVGSTPYPNDLFIRQIGRTLSVADIGLLREHRVLICDRDRKWSQGVRGLLDDAGIHVVLTPVRAPNANAYARAESSGDGERIDRGRANSGAGWSRVSTTTPGRAAQLLRARGVISRLG